jgi:signal transduction histidine kinase
MNLSRQLVTVRAAPRPTVRLRLTALYGALFLISGTGLLAITYLLARAGRFITVHAAYNGRVTTGAAAAARTHLPPGAVTRARPTGHAQSVIDLHQLLVLSAVALAIMAVLSIGLGWLVAGRVLRRLRTITRAAREISATNLHERLALDGPDDELKELGSTFDELLTRLDGSFNAQRQFVANASHELRTPLARQRTLLEIALSDPHATIESLQANNQRVLAAGEEQERLIEALLTLARSEQALDHREPLDLATIGRQMLGALAPQAELRDVEIESKLSHAPSSGDRRLLERLTANLIDNAIRYNHSSGHIEVKTGLKAGTGTSPDHAFLTVANTGPVIAPEDLERLFKPFERLDPDRRARRDGSGLGLSIVRAIATAHGATLTARAQPHGGLWIEIGFPATTPPADRHIAPPATPASNQQPDPVATHASTAGAETATR